MGEARPLAGGDAQHVIQHQHLGIAVRTRADADHRNPQGIADPGSERCRNTLQQQQIRARILQRQGIVMDPPGALLVTPLHPVTPQLVYRLGLQSEVRTHRNALTGEATHRLQLHGPSFQLHHLRPALFHQPAGVRNGLPRIHVGQERHIGHQQRPTATTGHAAGMVDHLVEGHRQGALLPLNHHSERIPHQQDLHPRRIEQRGEAAVVGGQTGELLSRLLHLLQGGEGDPLHALPCSSSGRGLK